MGVILTSTAMDSLTDRAVYFGRNAQWRKLRDKQCISDITCFKEEPRPLDRTYIFSRGKSAGLFSHKFCFAYDTGLCSYHRETQSHYHCNQNRDKDLFHVCEKAK